MDPELHAAHHEFVAKQMLESQKREQSAERRREVWKRARYLLYASAPLLAELGKFFMEHWK